MDLQAQIEAKAAAAREAARALAVLPTSAKNKALLAMANALVKRQDKILQANAQDIEAGRAKKLSRALLDRLLLNEDRVRAMAEGLRQTAALPDPVGEEICGMRRPNGLEIRKVRVPLGVIGIIYEARPNVTADAMGLCLKAGNAVVLRGGSEAIHSNTALVSVLSAAAYEAGIPDGAVQFIDVTDRTAVNILLKLRGFLDVVIPRGGAGLIRAVVSESAVPVIETGTGVCHTFVDASADLAMARGIALNAKVSRPAVCNAMETLLVHEAVVADFLPEMLEAFRQAGVEVRGCAETLRYDPNILPASEADWETEYGDLIVSVKIVPDLDAAVGHIARYGTKHSEAIVTRDYSSARRFQQCVDAAAVYVNASTRFTDGFEFGFGGEIGISTQKLHARGPMGLPELTSVKYLISGDGQVR